MLLVQHHDSPPAHPSEPDALPYWVLPGGGEYEGQPPQDASKRELYEETGIRATGIGRLVWVRRTSLFRHGEPRPYVESWFLEKADRGIEPPRMPPPNDEARNYGPRNTAPSPIPLPETVLATHPPTSVAKIVGDWRTVARRPRSG